MTLANYLYALIFSDVYDKQRWQKWGEMLLRDADFNQDTEWVFNVIFANNKQKVFDVLSERKFDEDYLYYNKYALTEIIQGYYYYQYKKGKISLYDLLNKSGDVADAGDDSTGCEFFYNLLNQIDEDANIINNITFKKTIDNYFYPLYKAALDQKQKLESCNLEDLLIEKH